MPPIRSITAATKPIKTERTHEENQERAYIAASRRSDRSLEARIESARRASEIHKRRTGRSLRVTEQDVVNEEMYEEEDDDLPMQYRRLTAHLNNNSSEFNRRLAAYLTNHVAMRNALDQAISSSYAQQQQQSPEGASPLRSNFQQPWKPSPGLAQYAKQMLPPQVQQNSSNSPRTAPYPNANASSMQSHRPQLRTQGNAGDPPNQPVKAHSFPKTQHSTTKSSAQRLEDRRYSAPAVPHVDRSRISSKPPPRLPLNRSMSDSSPPDSCIREEDENDDTNMTTYSEPELGSPQFSNHYPSLNKTESFSMSPLSMTLPPETQMFFRGGPGGSHDVFGNPIGGNNKMQEQFYPSSNMGNFTFNKSPFDGMNQTLAPEAFDDQTNYQWSTNNGATDNQDQNAMGSDFDFSSAHHEFGNDVHGGLSSFMMDSLVSGQLTPADNDWAALIDTNSWDDNET